MLSDAAVTALIVAIPTTLASLGALIVSVLSAIRSRDNGSKVDIVTTKVEAVMERAEEIHVATNGSLSAANAATAAANSLGSVLVEQVNGLKRELAALKLSGTLAAAAAEQAATDVREAQAVTLPMKGESE